MLPTSWTPVNSSAISRVKFTPNRFDSLGTLYIEFNEGAVYSYTDVQESRVEALMSSASPGSYYKSAIAGQYASQREG